MGNFKSYDENQPMTLDAQASIQIWVEQPSNGSKILAAQIDVKELEFKFNLVLKNQNMLSMEIL